ncbi:SatD family protein [Christiangramia sediminis]|uniref:SatD family protein n=1 Tax=Christiangramia sediminis TaxID=2881336 RepID=A0A9X1LGS6_9FLAO|nr:SatD family protein [Christiangramia sediminis]MCB7480076.1 SatD family protein [Christiangramia sediminis]
MIAVLSADLLSSSSYPKQLMEKVISSLNREFKALENLSKEDSGFKIFRGDSFQGIVYDPSKALKAALQLKTAINRLHLHENGINKAFKKEADLRLAIGIGSYDFKRDSILESNGQAFQFSGRTLDDMKKENRKLQLKTPSENINAEFDTSLILFDAIADKWSTASAEVIYYLLKAYKETEIASELGISQSAVNQRKKAAGWDAIDKLLTRYESVIKEHFSNGE